MDDRLAYGLGFWIGGFSMGVVLVSMLHHEPQKDLVTPSKIEKIVQEEKRAVIANDLTKRYDLNNDGWLSVGEQEHIERCARDSDYAGNHHYVPEPPYKP